MAEQIFQERNTNVNRQHLQDIKNLTDKVDELSEKLEDKQSCMHRSQKSCCIKPRRKIKELEEENKKLRCELDRSKYNPQNTTDFPAASDLNISFLERLVRHYTGTHVSSSGNQRQSSVSQPQSQPQSQPHSQPQSQHTPPTDSSFFDDNSYEDETLFGNGGEYSPEVHQQESVQRKQQSQSGGLRTVTCGKYTYTITANDLKLEQEAFEAGEGKRELVKGFGVYLKFMDLEMFEQSSKSSATGLMRSLMGIWYSNARLAACSATSGINPNIRTAVFKYCEMKYPGKITPDKLKRDLTSKCGEERRKLTKTYIAMPRGPLKKILLCCIPEEYYRPLYSLISSLLITMTFCFWVPIPSIIWDIQSRDVRQAIYCISALCWFGVMISLLSLDALDLLGIREPLYQLMGWKKEIKFVKTGLYGIVRHPVYSFLILSLWITPTMTIGHLLLTVMYSTYILVAVALYEEPDLIKRFGAKYEQYVTATPGYIPKICFFTKTKSKQQ